MAAAVFAGFSVFVSSAWADSSVLTAENVCAQPSLLKATCTAQILLNEKTGQPLSFSVQPQPLLQDGEAANKVKSVAPGSVQSAGFGVSASAPAASLGTPQFLQQAYDLSALSVTAGYGDTVAIVDVGVGYQDLESDLAQYRAAYSLPPCVSASGCLRIVDENGGSNYPTTADGNSPGWGFETALDVDAVSAICPNCHILVVEASSETVSSYEAAENTAYRLGANQISNSWLEFWSFNRSDFVFPGVATVAAAGDYGYLNDPYSTPYPASFSGVTAVGGTALTPASTATARGVEETAAAGDSSSCSNEPQPTWQANANGGCADGLSLIFQLTGKPVQVCLSTIQETALSPATPVAARAWLQPLSLPTTDS
jgi:subtilase family serine protease